MGRVLIKAMTVWMLFLLTAMLGFFWTSLTVAFEFLFGHYARGASLGMLLTDYNLLKGRLWSLVVIAMLVSSVITAKIKGMVQQH